MLKPKNLIISNNIFLGEIMGKKKFTGSIVLLIILILICWPAALVYFFLNYEEGGTGSERICPSCGRSIPVDAKVCPYCGKKFPL